MTARKKILIIDSDQKMAANTASILADHNYETRVVNDGETALRELPVYHPDLVLSELVLPGMDGYHVCREIRRISDIPLILCSEKSESYDIVLGLDLGADDYIVLPYDKEVLLARIRAVLRRYHVSEGTVSSGDEKCVVYPDLTINLTNYSVICQGERIEMPPKELELLYFLAASPNQVFTREQLLDHLWGYDYIGDIRTVDVHIKRVREKLKNHPRWTITTVWGVGYKFDVKNA